MYSEQYISSIKEALDSTVYTADNAPMTGDQALDKLSAITLKTKNDKGRLFFIGNGASASFADHMSLDWSKNGGVASLNLAGLAQLTALSNDISYDNVYQEPLKWHANSKDILVTISSSGNSKNIINAIETAKSLGMKIVTLSGLKADNKSRALGDINLYVPAKTYGIVECTHQCLLHMWLDAFMGIEEWDRSTSQNMNLSEFQL